MIILDRKDFLIQCAKANKTLEEALPCVIDMNDNLWTVDENHSSYPQIIFSSNSNQQIILCGSIAGLDKIQQDFISRKQGSKS